MGLEHIKRNCFNFELGKCTGACSLDETPEKYNERFMLAFKNRKVKKWPYKTPLIIKEQSEDSTSGVGYIIDNWCLVSKIKFDHEVIHKEELNRGFDLETYRLLAKAIGGKFKHLTIASYQMDLV
jgi:DNA polymerase-3 subunit epsilon